MKKVTILNLVEMLGKSTAVRLSDLSKRALAEELYNNGVRIPPINVGDYLWTDVGEDDEVVIGKVKVVSVTQTENGYDICLGEGLGENYRITEEDIDNGDFFRTEELAQTHLQKRENVV